VAEEAGAEHAEPAGLGGSQSAPAWRRLSMRCAVAVMGSAGWPARPLRSGAQQKNGEWRMREQGQEVQRGIAQLKLNQKWTQCLKQ
jgi:hypothetical protein